MASCRIAHAGDLVVPLLHRQQDLLAPEFFSPIFNQQFDTVEIAGVARQRQVFRQYEVDLVCTHSKRKHRAEYLGFPHRFGVSVDQDFDLSDYGPTSRSSRWN